MARKCTFCGSELQEGDVYCGKCGNLAPGMTPPANAWSKVEADLGGAPRKKKGCLRALLIFFLIIVLLVAALYVSALARSSAKKKNKESKAGASASAVLDPAVEGTVETVLSYAVFGEC